MRRRYSRSLTTRYRTDRPTSVAKLGRKPRYKLHPLIVVDQEDAHLLQKSWRALTNGHRIYACRWEGKECVLLHRLIMKAKPGQVVDHLNGIGLDCRKVNLKLTTQANNMLREHPNGGVYKKGNRWRVHMSNKYLGTFDTEAEARAFRSKERTRRLAS